LIAGILTITSLLLTSCTDPGIIPRSKSQNSNNEIIPNKSEIIEVNGYLYSFKYCDTCGFYKPPRSTHCRQCDNCVEKWDHHCPWMGTCIGKRNYRYFFLFCFQAGFYSIVAVFVCVTQIILRIFYGINNVPLIYPAYYQAVIFSLLWSIPSFLLILYFSTVFLLPTMMTIIHTYFISSGQTTYENIKGYHFYYSKSLLYNWWIVFCTRNQKSFLNLN